MRVTKVPAEAAVEQGRLALEVCGDLGELVEGSLEILSDFGGDARARHTRRGTNRGAPFEASIEAQGRRGKAADTSRLSARNHKAW